MRALSVAIARSAGINSRSPNPAAASKKDDLKCSFAATPPLKSSVLARCFSTALNVFDINTSVTALSHSIAYRAFLSGDRGLSFWIEYRTAVFSPEKEKLKSFEWSIGRGSLGFCPVLESLFFFRADLASREISGPPG